MSRRTTSIKKVIVALMLVFPYLASGQSLVTIKEVDEVIHNYPFCLDYLKQPISRIIDNAQVCAAQCKQVNQATSYYLTGLEEKRIPLIKNLKQPKLFRIFCSTNSRCSQGNVTAIAIVRYY